MHVHSREQEEKALEKIDKPHRIGWFLNDAVKCIYLAIALMQYLNPAVSSSLSWTSNETNRSGHLQAADSSLQSRAYI